MSSEALQLLMDRSDIQQMIARLALGMDTRNQAMFQSCWADEFYLSVPPLAGDGVPLEGNMRADEHARNVIVMLSEFKATQHVLTNHLIEVKGDKAECSVYLIGTHTMANVDGGDPIQTIGARYDFDCMRSDTGWKITRLIWTRYWSTGNAGLWDMVGRRAAEKLSPGA